MADFISYARRLILSLDSTDDGDLIRASGHPKKLQFDAFEVPSPNAPQTSTSPISPLSKSCTDAEHQTRIIGVILWGQTCDHQDKELRVTECLKKELLELAESGEGGKVVVQGVAWRIMVVEGVQSSDGVESSKGSII